MSILTREALKRIFHDSEEEGRNLENIMRRLMKITDSSIIEHMCELLTQGYNRNTVYRGEKIGDLFAFGDDKIFVDAEKGSRYGLNVVKSGAPVLIPDPCLGSKKYSEITVIGLCLPHELTGRNGLFRAVLLEKTEEPEKYLLLKYYRYSEGKIKNVLETNDFEYAKEHKQLGFKVE